MALILKEEKLIFVHIPKTGGKSICHALGYLNMTNWDSINQEPLENTHVNSTHIKLIVGDFWDEAFKFAVIRDEHERLVSFYHYGLWKQVPNPFSDFEDFIHYVVGEKEVKLSASNEGWKYARLNSNHYLTQSLDLLIEFNDLKTGWGKVCEYLNQDYELPHINKSVHSDYKDYYNKETFKLIEQWSQQE